MESHCQKVRVQLAQWGLACHGILIIVSAVQRRPLVWTMRGHVMASYSEKAQPYLDAIAEAVFSQEKVRNWLLAGTRHETAYTNAKCLDAEQKVCRGKTKQPFYCNYWCSWCERDMNCGIIRIVGFRRVETDLMAFLESDEGRRLAIHIEFKRDGETLKCGQAEAYPLRAECWATNRYKPRSVLIHQDWLTVIFCGDDAKDSSELAPFERRISHSEARSMIERYPR